MAQSSGLYSHGIDSHGLDSNGLYSHGPNSYGLRGCLWPRARTRVSTCCFDMRVDTCLDMRCGHGHVSGAANVSKSHRKKNSVGSALPHAEGRTPSLGPWALVGRGGGEGQSNLAFIIPTLRPRLLTYIVMAYIVMASSSYLSPALVHRKKNRRATGATMERTARPRPCATPRRLRLR